jgi:hypothetical protein
MRCIRGKPRNGIFAPFLRGFARMCTTRRPGSVLMYTNLNIVLLRIFQCYRYTRGRIEKTSRLLWCTATSPPLRADGGLPSCTDTGVPLRAGISHRFFEIVPPPRLFCDGRRGLHFFVVSIRITFVAPSSYFGIVLSIMLLAQGWEAIVGGELTAVSRCVFCLYDLS